MTLKDSDMLTTTVRTPVSARALVDPDNPTPLTERETEAVAAAGGVSGGVLGDRRPRRRR